MFKSLVIIVNLLFVALFSAPYLPQAGSAALAGGDRVSHFEKHVEAAPDLSSLDRGAQRYLEQGFAIDWPATAGSWQQWIIVDDGSDWTVGKLRMVRQALLNTISALDSSGLDGAELLAGYRFRLTDSQFVNDQPNRQALVNHELQLITLAQEAFRAHQGFVIYHELGHIVDHRLARTLTNLFAGEAADAGLESYGIRAQARQNPSEAAADAFALWTLVGYAGYEAPSFPSSEAPADASENAAQLIALVSVHLQVQASR